MKMDKDPISLKFVAVSALVSPSEGERGVTGAERFGRYQLAKRVHSGAGTFSSFELEKIKKHIGEHFVPMIVGAAWEALDGGLPSIGIEKTEGCEP